MSFNLQHPTFNIIEMSYYFSTTIHASFEEAIERATDALKKEGFGVLTEIKIHEKLKEKIGVDFQRYTILGACNPPMAYKALQAENKIGTMLPCNVIVQDIGDGNIEIAAVNPIESMKAIVNPELGAVATQVTEMLQRVVLSLKT
jgi:uncharacterized protein (DUF302 family)